jgi:Domain of unknown function (DUF4336)
MREFGADIWLIDGPPVRAFGIRLPTRMIVVRLRDGSLWINSPVAVSKSLLASIELIGPPRYLVAPTPLHVWRLEEWRRLFPRAELWGPPSIASSPRRRTFAGVLGDETPEQWKADLDQVVFRGNAFLQEVEFLHKPSRTVVFADFLQNYPPDKSRLFLSTLQRLAGVWGLGVPIDIRLTTFNRRLARSSAARMLAWDFDRLVVAHGENLEREARRSVRRAFAWLEPLPDSPEKGEADDKGGDNHR